MTSQGKEGCPCIDASSLLESSSDRHCKQLNGEDGVYIKPSASCAPFSFGSDACLKHDLVHDANCQKNSGLGEVPDYCHDRWCFVDMETCKRESDDQIFRSKSFPESHLFWSYTTCGSNEGVAQAFLEETADMSVLGNVNLTSAIPGYDIPYLYKRDPSGGKIKDRGDEYYDDLVPVEGVYIDYATELMKVSGGDINSISYTHTSRSSSKMHNSSSFTAAVQDIQNGLVDMSVGPFWVTETRLKMAAFTIPFTYDQTVLAIPNPGTSRSINYEIAKVGQPFTPGLWMLVICVIFFTALLSVWFSEREKIAKMRYGAGTRKENNKPNKSIWLRLFMDEMIHKWVFFCSAGVEQDRGASLPAKLLMFGFGFFILITVSAYVANLAAFLTQSAVSSDGPIIIEQVPRSMPICANAGLEEELRYKWPYLKWVFADDFHSMLDKYNNTDCEVLAIGKEDTTMDIEFLNRMCDMELRYTDSVITDNPMAFPIKPELASGISHWMYVAKKNGIDIQSAKDAYNINEPKCNTELVVQQESDEYTQINPMNMILPLIVFLVSAVIAIVLQIMADLQSKGGAMIGRLSTLPHIKLPKRERETGLQQGITASKDDEAPQSNESMPAVEDGGFSESCLTHLESMRSAPPSGAERSVSGLSTSDQFESKLLLKIKHAIDDTMLECSQEAERLKKQE